jgi:hypothetical protein
MIQFVTECCLAALFATVCRCAQAVEGLERMAAGQEQEDAVRKEAITVRVGSVGVLST